jgi:hypothetical protein
VPSQSLSSSYIGTTTAVAWLPSSIDGQAAQRFCPTMRGDQLYGVVFTFLWYDRAMTLATDYLWPSS